MEPTGRNETYRLHREDGPALLFADGWSVHSWHGIRVPEWVITSPTPKRIAEETNAEIRRCAIESYGWARFVIDAELAECAPADSDPGNPGQLLRLYDVPETVWGAAVRLLVCTNGTIERDGTRRIYGLTTPVDVKTPLEAAAWTAGVEPSVYAGLERRS